MPITDQELRGAEIINLAPTGLEAAGASAAMFTRGHVEVDMGN